MRRKGEGDARIRGAARAEPEAAEAGRGLRHGGLQDFSVLQVGDALQRGAAEQADVHRRVVEILHDHGIVVIEEEADFGRAFEAQVEVGARDAAQLTFPFLVA